MDLLYMYNKCIYVIYNMYLVLHHWLARLVSTQKLQLGCTLLL